MIMQRLIHGCAWRAWLALVAATALTITGCGGGDGGGGNEMTAINQPTVPPTLPLVPPVSPPGEMTLLAGAIGGAGSSDGTPGRFNQPSGIAADAAGNVYVADKENHTIRKVTPSGVVTLAGKPGVRGSTNGTGAAALFSMPISIAVDTLGNAYVIEQSRYSIRKITPTGIVTTLAGVATELGSVDGTGVAARFDGPTAIAVDAVGTVFVAEQYRVRKITSEGVVTTLAGTIYGSSSYIGSSAPSFGRLTALALDRSGNVFVTDVGNQLSLVHKITPTGVVTTIAGMLETTPGVTPAGYHDGGPGIAQFGYPTAIVADADGALYVLDTSRIRKVTQDGFVRSLDLKNPDGTSFVRGNGYVDKAGLAIATDGSIFLSSPTDNTIKLIKPDRTVMTVAGTPAASGTADGAGGAARFSGPVHLAVDAAGNVIVTDGFNNSVRRITPSGVVTTLASNLGVQEPLRYPLGIRPEYVLGLAIEKSGALLVVDPHSHLILRIGTDGSKSVAAGSAWPNGVSGGFFGSSVGRSVPTGVAVDSAGTMYVADGIIRKITAGGADTILACSNLPTCLPAEKLPSAIAVDAGDNIYVAVNGSIVKITPAGVSSILAGSGTAGFRDGTGSEASFGEVGGYWGPRALTVDAAGNVFVADTSNHAIRKITPAGVVTTIAGKSGATGVVLGTLPAGLSFPEGIAVDAAGMIYVSSENAVLKIKP